MSEPASEAQIRAMFAAFDELGIADRDERLDYFKRVLADRPSSSRELTKEEASVVVAALEDELRRDPSRLFENAARAKAHEKRDLLRGLGVHT